MNIKGGALEFDIIANNGQINSALAETKRRVQGFTDATVEGGDRMEAAYREAAAQIEAAFKDIDTMAAIHSNAIADLEKEYARLGEAAGAPNVNKSMALFSAKYGSMNDLQVRASTYYVPDILWSSYADVGGTIKENEDLRVQLAAQFAVQGSNGMNLLTGQSFSTFWGGFRADAFWGPMAFRVSYTQIGSAAAWRNPYGIFIGYNKMQSLDFNRAGEMAVTAGATYDFKGAGLPGVIFLATATYGGNSVNPQTHTSLSNNWEYDLELAIRGDAMPNAPGWLKPFNLRNRVAFVDQYLNNTVTSYTEYRVQLNYELTWKGPRLRQASAP